MAWKLQYWLYNASPMILTIALLLAAGFCFLMLTPLTIEVDTDRRLYRIKLKGIVTARIVFLEGKLLIQLWIFGWQTSADPFRRTIERSKLSKKTEKKKVRHLKPSTIFRKTRAVLRSFTVSSFYLNVDTDDYATNAWLYPIAGVLTNGKQIYRINYQGNLTLRFRIENRIGKLLFALTQ